MKVWLLLPVKGDPIWKPWYDKVFGFVVRAETEEAAREIAAKDHGDEGPRAWTVPERSTCVELTGEGAAGVILRHCAYA